MTPEFTKSRERLLSQDLYQDLLRYLAANPTAGDTVRGLRGVRKLRWRLPGRGKRGGSRVIYYFTTPDDPLWLITMYAKSDQDDLSADQKKRVKEIVGGLKADKR